MSLPSRPHGISRAATRLLAHGLLAPAIPVRVQVPEQWLPRARDVLSAFERGDYGLSDDHLDGDRPS